jgi:tRNA-dihydrouridine synthase
VIAAMTKAVKIPVTVKMRAGWNDHQKNAPELALRVADAGASAIAVHGRTASQSYSGFSDWDFISGVAESVNIPVFGSGDVIEADQAIERLRSTAVSGVLIGRGVLRNPWILGQANDLLAGRTPRVVTMQERGQFLLDYIDLLLREGEGEAEGFRHVASKHDESNPSRHDRAARGRDRWVINKLRALGAWYTRGLDNGSRLRTAINTCDSIGALRSLVTRFFFENDPLADERPAGSGALAAAD